MKAAGWLKGLEVTAGGTEIGSHAGLALLRALSDSIGLTAGLPEALASRRLLVHDRGRVVAGLACAIAGGAGVISDFRMMADQGEPFGLVASVPTCWRALSEIAGGGRAPDRRRGICTGSRSTPWWVSRPRNRGAPPAGDSNADSHHAPGDPLAARAKSPG